MATLRKILLLNLPASVENALREQFLDEEEAFIAAETGGVPGGEIFDLIIHKIDTVNTFPPAVPLLPLSLTRKERLGAILRQMMQMMEEPSLWVEDFALGQDLCRPSEKALIRKNGEETALTDKEADILCYLARHNGRPVAREALLKNVWRYGEGVDTHTLETHIYRLRQKIEEKAEAPRFLLTDDAGGYRLNLSGAA